MSKVLTGMKSLICSTAVLLVFASCASADRLPPKEVPSIHTEKAVISVPHFSTENGLKQNGGVVVAHDSESKELLWQIQVYKTVYDENLEGDVQDIFIKTLTFDKDHNLLILSDEDSRIFVINLATKRVTQIQ